MQHKMSMQVQEAANRPSEMMKMPQQPLAVVRNLKDSDVPKDALLITDDEAEALKAVGRLHFDNLPFKNDLMSLMAKTEGAAVPFGPQEFDALKTMAGKLTRNAGILGPMRERLLSEARMPMSKDVHEVVNLSEECNKFAIRTQAMLDVLTKSGAGGKQPYLHRDDCKELTSFVDHLLKFNHLAWRINEIELTSKSTALQKPVVATAVTASEAQSIVSAASFAWTFEDFKHEMQALITRCKISGSQESAPLGQPEVDALLLFKSQTLKHAGEMDAIRNRIMSLASRPYPKEVGDIRSLTDELEFVARELLSVTEHFPPVHLAQPGDIIITRDQARSLQSAVDRLEKYSGLATRVRALLSAST